MTRTSEELLYREILVTAITAVGSDAGSLQLVDDQQPERLRLIAWRGFDPASAAFWQYVEAGSLATCGAAFAAAGRVVVEDVEAVPEFSGSDDLHEWRRSGVRAVQSTPLISHDGRVIGILSTHWRTPHTPSTEELRLVDLLAQAARATREQAQGRHAPHRTESRSRRSPRLLRALAERLDDPHRLPRQCAWCKRIELDGDFLRPEDALLHDLAPLAHRATSGICPACLAEQLHAGAAARAARDDN